MCGGLAWCSRPAAHSSHLLVSRGLLYLSSPPSSPGPQPTQCSPLTAWGNSPTSCPAPNPVASHPGLCLLLCVLRPAAHPLWAKVSPKALRMPRLVGLGCQGGSKEITEPRLPAGTVSPILPVLPPRTWKGFRPPTGLALAGFPSPQCLSQLPTPSPGAGLVRLQAQPAGASV